MHELSQHSMQGANPGHRGNGVRSHAHALAHAAVGQGVRFIARLT